MPDNRGEIVKIIPATNDPMRRVAIVQRQDGHYAIRPERLSTARWFPELVITSKWVAMELKSGIFASIELAEKEAFVLYRWIRPTEGPNE